MWRLFFPLFSLLLVAACDPDLTVAKPADGGREGGVVDPGPGPGPVEGGVPSDGDAGGGEDGSVEVDGGAPGHKIDGDNDFQPGEKFVTSSTATSPYEGFITWDDKRLYFGMAGPDIASGAADRWVLIYLDGATGTSTGLDYGGTQQPTLPFSAGYHIRWKASGQYTNGQRWDGAAWIDAAGAGLIPVAMQKGQFMEMSINRAAIGNPATVKVHMTMIKENGGDWTYAAVPSTSLTDGVDPNYTKYLELDLNTPVSVKAPNQYPPKP